MSEKTKNDSVEEIIDNTFKHIRNVVDGNSIIGDVVQLSSNVVLVPISKIKVGIISGGMGEASKKSKMLPSSAGSSSGISVSPVGFIVVVGQEVRYINASSDNDSMNKVIDSIGNLFSELVRSSNNEK